MRTARRIVHCIADCQNCEWRDEDYERAARRAAVHGRKTGHKVHVEQAVSYLVVPE